MSEPADRLSLQAALGLRDRAEAELLADLLDTTAGDIDRALERGYPSAEVACRWESQREVALVVEARVRAAFGLPTVR